MRFACLTLVLLACSAQAATRATSNETYRVKAQFRGAMKKDLGELGRVTIGYRSSAARATLSLQGDVKDPEEEGVSYRFSAEIALERAGNEIRSRAKSRFSADAEEYEDRVLEMAPFVYFLKHDAYPAKLPAEVTYRVNGKPYTVRYASSETGVEATLFDGLRTVGKFFLKPGPPNEVHAYEKFRVNTVQKTVLSFVKE